MLLSDDELKMICDKYLNTSIKKCKCPLFIDGICAKEYLNKINIDIDVDFDISIFLNIFKNRFGIDLNLSEDEIKELSRLAMLFNKSEEALTRLLYMSINDSLIDFNKLYSLCENEVAYINSNEEAAVKQRTTNTEYGKKINFMDRTSPVTYLSILSGHQKLSPSDIKLINSLSYKYNLSKGVINVIIEYTLTRLDDNLPRAYCEKLGSFLSRKNVKTSMEAINALHKYFKKTNNSAGNKNYE